VVRVGDNESFDEYTVKEKYIMKQKTVFSALAAGAVAVGLLLAASTAQAEDVIFDPSDPNKATGITDLDVGGTLYDVAFNLQAFAFEIYGAFPGNFPIFNTAQEAGDARDAVDAALNSAGALSLGEDGLAGVEANGFNIGFESFIVPIGDVESVNVARGFIEGTDWISGGINSLTYNLDERAGGLCLSDHQCAQCSGWHAEYARRYSGRRVSKLCIRVFANGANHADRGGAEL